MMNVEIDWIETKTNELLAKAKRSGYLKEAVADAKHFVELYGYEYDVALSIACKYWCS